MPRHLVAEVLGEGAAEMEVDLRVGLPLALEGVGSTPAAKGRRTKTVSLGPARKSARFQGSEATIPVLQRAQSRAAAKNLEDTGNSSDSDLEGFALLHKADDTHLASVAHDSGLAFALECGSQSEILSLVRAKEAAQAALAKAAFRKAEADRLVAIPTLGGSDGTVGAVSPPPEPAQEVCPSEFVVAPRRANHRGKAKPVLASRRGRRPRTSAQ
jgi:hypothetical protein